MTALRPATVLCVLVALTLPALASAGGPIGGGPAGGLYYYAGSSSLSVGGNQGRFTACSEPGTRVIGGGFDSDTASEDGFVSLATPQDAGDSDSKPDDGWFTDVVNVSGSPTNFTSYAICSFDAVKYPSATGAIKRGKTGTVKARCPSGTRGTAGGLESASTNLIRMSAVYPIDGGDADKKLDDGWAVKARNLDATKVTVTVRAVCAAGVKMLYRDDVGGLAHIDPNSTLGLSATPCNDDGFVSGGGTRPVKPLGASDASITASVPADTSFDADAVPDDRVSFEEVNDNPVAGGDVHFYTACVVRG
jgi:hypothetical protein